MQQGFLVDDHYVPGKLLKRVVLGMQVDQQGLHSFRIAVSFVKRLVAYYVNVASKRICEVNVNKRCPKSTRPNGVLVSTKQCFHASES